MERNIKERVSQYVDENKVKEKLTQFFQEKIVNRKAMFIRTVNIRCYMIAIILTMAFTFLINLYMRRVLKKIDMIESLKSIE